MNVLVIIPFRDRGDPLRTANLRRVFKEWIGYRHPVVIVDDGGVGDAQFNRSRAYNRGIAGSGADVFVLAEADMLIDGGQIDEAVELAAAGPGLVVPFSWFRAITPEDSSRVRACELSAADAVSSPVRGYRGSIGAINVISRETYELVGGFDEQFQGAHFDDDAMKIAFEVCAGPTRWVDGPAFHLYHLPGNAGTHLSAEDRAATARNKMRLRRYRSARTAEEIRTLTYG